MKSITITGLDGFVGRHLAVAAKAKGLRVIGVSRADALAIELREFVDEYFQADLTLKFPLRAIGDYVAHLAGLAAVGPSFQNPQAYISANSAMVTNLFETILSSTESHVAKVLVVSSGAVYAQTSIRHPIDEDGKIQFSSPYVVSKVLAENQTAYYRERGISAIVARPFNHIGPGQGTGFLVPDLFDRLRVLREGAALTAGNLDSSRDYLDVRDVVNAYLDLLLDPEILSGTFNVCSGASVDGWTVLAHLCDAMRIPVPQVKVEDSLLRPRDASHIVGSSQELRRSTGWKPKFSLAESIRDFVETQ